MTYAVSNGDILYPVDQLKDLGVIFHLTYHGVLTLIPFLHEPDQFIYLYLMFIVLNK